MTSFEAVLTTLLIMGSITGYCVFQQQEERYKALERRLKWDETMRELARIRRP